MNVYEFIDNMVARLNRVEVKGIENMGAIVQTCTDLMQLRSVIHVEEDKPNEADQNEQEENVPG